MSDRELLEKAAKAAGLDVEFPDADTADWLACNDYAKAHDQWLICNSLDEEGDVIGWWNPIKDDGDRLRLARKLGISIDYQDCCAWKRLPSGDLIQEFWGGECGDEAHAILRAVAAIGESHE